jgi:hypothetical protein
MNKMMKTGGGLLPAPDFLIQNAGNPASSASVLTRSAGAATRSAGAATLGAGAGTLSAGVLGPIRPRRGAVGVSRLFSYQSGG